MSATVDGSGMPGTGGNTSSADPCTPTVNPFQYSFVELRQVSVSKAPRKRSVPCGSEPPTPLLLSWYSKLPPPRSTMTLLAPPQPQ